MLTSSANPATATAPVPVITCERPILQLVKSEEDHFFRIYDFLLGQFEKLPRFTSKGRDILPLLENIATHSQSPIESYELAEYISFSFACDETVSEELIDSLASPAPLKELRDIKSFIKSILKNCEQIKQRLDTAESLSKSKSFLGKLKRTAHTNQLASDNLNKVLNGVQSGYLEALIDAQHQCKSIASKFLIDTSAVIIQHISANSEYSIHRLNAAVDEASRRDSGIGNDSRRSSGVSHLSQEAHLMVLQNPGPCAKSFKKHKAAVVSFNSEMLTISRGKKVLNLKFEWCTIRPQPSQKAFEIVSRCDPRNPSSNAGYYVSIKAENEQLSQYWSSKLRIAMESNFTRKVCAGTDGDNSNLYKDQGEILLATLQKSSPRNSICHDCRNGSPEWIDMVSGAFVCVSCAGMHRSMPNAQVRSVLMDRICWTKDFVSGWLQKHGDI